MIEGSELLARAIQHETDHLDGVLFVDRLDAEARKAAMKAIREAEWFGLEQPHGQGLAARRPSGLGSLMRVVFAGTPEVAAAVPSTPIADSRHELVGVVTRPDAPAGRGRKLVAEPGRAARRGARRTRPQARPPARPGVPGRAARAGAGLLPGGRVRRAAAAVAPSTSRAHGWVNLHFSLLPAWRGAAPVQHAIWAGDEVTGATTFRIVKELDAGPTFGVMTERIRPTDTAGDLLERLAEGGAGLLVATLDGIEDGSARGPAAAGGGLSLRAQDHRRRRPRRLGRARRSRSTARSAPARRRPARGRRTTASGSSSAR